MENLCSRCKDGIRGMCCHINIPIGSFNIALENVPCPFLNKETMLCSDYENRKKMAPWCLHGKGMFGKGALPKECLYLTKDSKKEPNPKVKIRDILHLLPHHQQLELVGKYNFFNNVNFKKYLEWGLEKITKEEKIKQRTS